MPTKKIIFLFILFFGFTSASWGSEYISRSGFTSKITNREPVDHLKTIPSNTKTIYFFTELVNLKGRSVTHRWKINNQPAGSMRFRVGANRWRVNTKKTVSNGTLSVDVVLDDGSVVTTASIMNGQGRPVPVEQPANTTQNKTIEQTAKADAAPQPQDDYSVSSDLSALIGGNEDAQNAINELFGIAEETNTNTDETATPVASTPQPQQAPQKAPTDTSTAQPANTNNSQKNNQPKKAAEPAVKINTVKPTPATTTATNRAQPASALKAIEPTPAIVPQPQQPVAVPESLSTEKQANIQPQPAAKPQAPKLIQDKKTSEDVLLDAFRRELQKLPQGQVGIATQPQRAKPQAKQPVANTQKPANTNKEKPKKNTTKLVPLND